MANAPFYDKGRYVVRILEQALGTTGTGKPQIIIRFQVLSVIVDGEKQPISSYPRTFYRVLTDNTIEYAMKDLETLGFTGESIADIDQNTQGFCDLRGQEIEMLCGHEKDLQGNQREKWSIAHTGTGEPMEYKPVERSTVRQLDNLFGKQLKTLSKKAQPEAVRQPAAVPVPDDDVPF